MKYLLGFCCGAAFTILTRGTFKRSDWTLAVAILLGGVLVYFGH